MPEFRIPASGNDLGDRHLDMAKGDVDSMLPFMASFPKLEVLILANTPVTDAALVHLARCPRLKEVPLAMTGITDAGLRHPASVKSLTEVRIDKKTKVTPQGIPRFEKLVFGNLTHPALQGCFNVYSAIV